MRPLRMQLSRKRGFDLQAASHALNGLPAKRVTRPGPWGNPFTIEETALRYADVLIEIAHGNDGLAAISHPGRGWRRSATWRPR